MTWWQILIVVWLTLGIAGGIVVEACEAYTARRPTSYADNVLAGALAAPLVVPIACCCVHDWRVERAQRGADAVEVEYQEVLRLIDWEPKTRTALDELQDELAVGVRAPADPETP